MVGITLREDDVQAKKGLASMTKVSGAVSCKVFEFARVLLVDDNPASRLTLQTVLKAGGYRVDAAASAAEAYSKLDEHEYELVLSDIQMESPEAGLRVIAHARMMAYKPATALVTAWHEGSDAPDVHHNLVEPGDVPEILTKVADLIGERASRRLARDMRQSGN